MNKGFEKFFHISFQTFFPMLIWVSGILLSNSAFSQSPLNPPAHGEASQEKSWILPENYFKEIYRMVFSNYLNEKIKYISDPVDYVGQLSDETSDSYLALKEMIQVEDSNEANQLIRAFAILFIEKYMIFFHIENFNLETQNFDYDLLIDNLGTINQAIYENNVLSKLIDDQFREKFNLDIKNYISYKQKQTKAIDLEKKEYQIKEDLKNNINEKYYFLLRKMILSTFTNNQIDINFTSSKFLSIDEKTRRLKEVSFEIIRLMKENLLYNLERDDFDLIYQKIIYLGDNIFKEDYEIWTVAKSYFKEIIKDERVKLIKILKNQSSQ